MNDSGNMKAYLIKTKSDGYSIYFQYPLSAIIDKGIEEGKFFYRNDKASLDTAEKIVKGELEDSVATEISADMDEVTNLLGSGYKMQESKKEFNNKAKSLFELVMAGAKK